MNGLLRGTVWEYAFAEDQPPKAALIVSNNARNRSTFPSVHVVRITTAPPKFQLETIVELPSHERLGGWAICDDLALVRKSGLGRPFGALAPATMRQIDAALRVVLAL